MNYEEGCVTSHSNDLDEDDRYPAEEVGGDDESESLRNVPVLLLLCATQSNLRVRNGEKHGDVSEKNEEESRKVQTTEDEG